MERRNFLRGIVLGAASVPATALVRLASDEEVKTLGTQKPVTITEAGTPTVPMVARWPGDGLAYIKEGNDYLPVGYIKNITVAAGVRDYGTWDGEVLLVPGLLKATMTFRGQTE